MSELHHVLSRRERQIMDILFRRGRATAAEVMADLPANSTYSTVRTQLRVLEDKGHVRHDQDGPRFVYAPVAKLNTARRSALRHVVDAFFEGSREQVVEALLGGKEKLSGEQLDRIADLIARARTGEK